MAASSGGSKSGKRTAQYIRDKYERQTRKTTNFTRLPPSNGRFRAELTTHFPRRRLFRHRRIAELEGQSQAMMDPHHRPMGSRPIGTKGDIGIVLNAPPSCGVIAHIPSPKPSPSEKTPG